MIKYLKTMFSGCITCDFHMGMQAVHRLLFTKQSSRVLKINTENTLFQKPLIPLRFSFSPTKDSWKKGGVRCMLVHFTASSLQKLRCLDDVFTSNKKKNGHGCMVL